MNNDELIVIIDDDTEVGKIISDVLEDNNYKAKHFPDGESAVSFIAQNSVSVVFLDLWMDNSESAGFNTLGAIKKINKHIPVIMISGHGNIDTAVKAIKLGAHDFVEKPFNIDKLIFVTQRAAEITRLRKANEELRAQSDFNAYLLGNSAEITKVRGIVKKCATSNSRVLINSGIGCGTELIARYIYENSTRNENHFLCVDCNNSDSDSIEAELFGDKTSTGALEYADGGTLLLSNVFELNSNLQSKLLRFLQNGSFSSYLSDNKKESDVRLISSCINTDIANNIKEKKIREDLFFRLSVIQINIPLLRNRREDIPSLVNYFLTNSVKIFNTKSAGIEKEALNIISSYSWPGNVRQLKNVIELSLIMSNSKTITASDLPRDLIHNDDSDAINELSKLISMSLKEAREIFEKNYINMQIDRFSGNISQVANFIGMERSALHRKIKSLEITNVRCRGGE